MTTPRRPPQVGALAAGPRDALSDVAGITVGHCTLADGELQTGVTVVRPHAGDLYRDRVPAAAVVINGFGKSIGLLQLDELGQIDTPIALTNTFSVPAVATAQIRQCIRANPATGRGSDTVNPLVLECNDGHLNDMQRMAIGEPHYLAAHDGAAAEFTQGSVGAGRGMSSFGLKGGIGTASRLAGAGRAGGFTVGALVLANHGKPQQLILAGDPIGARLAGRWPSPPPADEPERGSIIMLIATDAPLDARQLRRLALRAGAGLARTGSVFGHGSGDIALAFSTAYTLPRDPQDAMPALAMLHETLLDGLFQAAADATEQAVVHALWWATAVSGRSGHRRAALRDLPAAPTPIE